MSPLDRPVPPAGEEIHLPGGSLQPVLLAVGLTLALVGVTISMVLVVFGAVLSVAVIVRWIMDARREMAHLPLDHDSH
ncbi:MAG: hypothetical protein H0T43_10260 [Solirubrobacterales bacterium]|nr:hypothetical protein [Solirubrobacterales bacterium]